MRDSGLNVSEIALALTMDEQSLLVQLDKKRLFRRLVNKPVQEYVKLRRLAKVIENL